MPVMNARAYQQGCCFGYLIFYIFAVFCALGTVTCTGSTRPSTAYNPPPKPLDNPYPRLLHERDVIHYLDWHGQRVVIGSGSYADVSIGELRGQGTHVVIKTFMDSAFKSIVKEVRMHRYVEKLGFTSRLIGLLPTGPLAANISLVYEYVPFSKSLSDWLDETEDLTNIQWLQICHQTASIMLRLHQNHVLFNDLHRSNVLVQKLDDVVKVFYIDFGHATYKQGKEYTSSYDSMKEHKFLAPELRKDTLTTEASDVFALGYSLYKIAKKINNTRLLHLSHWCNESEPSNRPGLDEVISNLDTILLENSVFKHDINNIQETTDESFNESSENVIATNAACATSTSYCERHTTSETTENNPWKWKFDGENSRNWVWLKQNAEILSNGCPVPLFVLDEHDFVLEDEEDTEWLSKASNDSIRLAVLRSINQTVVVKEFYNVDFESIRDEMCMTSLLGQLGVAPQVIGLLIEYKKLNDEAFVQEFYGSGVSLKQFLSFSDGYDWHREALQMATEGDIIPEFSDRLPYVQFDTCTHNASMYLRELLRVISKPVSKAKSFRHRILENISYQLCQKIKTVHEAGYLINNFRVNNILVKWKYSDNLPDSVEVKLIDLASVTPTNYGRKLYSRPESLARHAYLAPELVNGSRSTKESDIYSLCVVLYRLMQDYINLVDEELSLQRYRWSSYNHCRKQNTKSSMCKSYLQHDSETSFFSSPDLEDAQNLPFQQYQHLLLRCFSKNPRQRPSISELMSSLKSVMMTESVFI